MSDGIGSIGAATLQRLIGLQALIVEQTEALKVVQDDTAAAATTAALAGVGDLVASIRATIAADEALAAALKAAFNTHAANLANPHAVTAAQVGAYTSAQVDALLAALRTALRVGATVQAWDVDLDAISTLTTAAFGRSLLTGADAPTVRAMLALGTAALLPAGLPGGTATLDASTGKLLSSQIPDALLGAVRYQGGWNAATNAPAIGAPSAANKGFYYIVTADGATALAGPNGSITDWKVGDWAVSDGTYWEKVDSSDQVVSVAGLQGAITAAGLKSALSIASTDITDATANGRAIMAAANAAAVRTLLSLVIGTNVQAWDADLDAIAALSTAPFGRSLLTLADAASTRKALALNTAGSVSYRNRLRNAGFTVNQRAVSGTVTLSAGQYGHDGWKGGANGCTYTFTRSGGIVTINITAGSLVQTIEGAFYMRDGGSFTLSWIGTATGQVNSVGFAASPVSVTGLQADTNASVEFGVGTLAMPQFEQGAARSDFELRDDEMARCLRYFQFMPASIGYVQSSDTTRVVFCSSFARMAAVPTPALINTSNALQVVGSYFLTPSALPSYQFQVDRGIIVLTVPSDTAGRQVAMYGYCVTLSAEL